MNEQSFRLFPEAASSYASQVDAVYLFLVGVAIFFTILICVLILYFGIKYRRGSKAKRGNVTHNTLLEIVWSVIPLGIAMISFVWGATVFFEMQTPPDDALVIEVVGKQWMWKVQHPGGKSEINALHLPVGQPVRLRMISEDVIHSFYVPAFRAKHDVLPAYYSQLWFQPTKVGHYHLFCAEYCGTEHSLMKGTVTVMEPTEYVRWLNDETGEAPAQVGAKLFDKFRCGTCHRTDGMGNGPSLVGVFGRAVPLRDGGHRTVDEQYLRDSILDPQKDIVAGFQPVMPTFQGQIEEQQVLSLIAYLKTLESAPPATPQMAAPNEQQSPSVQPAPVENPESGNKDISPPAAAEPPTDVPEGNSQ